MSRSVAALLALLLVVLCAATATGAPSLRVLVLQPDRELLRAITIALAPWGVDTTQSDVALPGSSQPEAVQTASRLAEQFGVEAVVWVTHAEQGSLLWVFDNRREVTTRALVEAPPFDGAAAAAVALSVKTILRGSAIAPPEERREVPASTPHAGHLVAMELGAGVHWLDESQLDLRVELAAVLWLSRAGYLGVSLNCSGGPGVSIDDSDYHGRYREFVMGGKARIRLIDLRRFSALVALGGAAHFTTLEGTLGESAGGSASTVNRLKGSFDLQTVLSLRVTRVMYLGASLEGSYLPAYQRYLVEGRPVFSPWPLSGTLAGYLGVELF